MSRKETGKRVGAFPSQDLVEKTEKPEGINKFKSIC